MFYLRTYVYVYTCYCKVIIIHRLICNCTQKCNYVAINDIRSFIIVVVFANKQNNNKVFIRTIFTRIVAQGYYYFLPKNKDKTLQIVPHCDIIRGCATIKFYTLMCILLYIKYYLLLTINNNSYNSFNCLQLCNMWRSYTQGYMNAQYRELWVKDGDDCDTFMVVFIMTKYIVGHVLKAITCHHLLLKICICGTIRGWTTIKINHENKGNCTRIVKHCGTIWICATNRVNTVTVACMLQFYCKYE